MGGLCVGRIHGAIASIFDVCKRRDKLPLTSPLFDLYLRLCFYLNLEYFPFSRSLRLETSQANSWVHLRGHHAWPPQSL